MLYVVAVLISARHRIGRENLVLRPTTPIFRRILQVLRVEWWLVVERNSTPRIASNQSEEKN